MADLPIELSGVADALACDKGFWCSCTGCHELNEGVPTGPFSKVMKCHLGMGCFECGGIGAIWDRTDYADMGRAMSVAAPSTNTLLEAVEIARTGRYTIKQIRGFLGLPPVAHGEETATIAKGCAE